MTPATGTPLRGDETELYRELAFKLVRIVRSQVRTSSANVDDACAFAWMQMLRYQPARETLLAWLATTGIREAIRLDGGSRWLDCWAVGDCANDAVDFAVYHPMDDRLEFLAAREAIVDAGLRGRESELLAAHIAGYSYVEIAHDNKLSTRTVERQLPAREAPAPRRSGSAAASLARRCRRRRRRRVLPLTIVSNMQRTFERPGTLGGRPVTRVRPDCRPQP